MTHITENTTRTKEATSLRYPISLSQYRINDSKLYTLFQRYANFPSILYLYYLNEWRQCRTIQGDDAKMHGDLSGTAQFAKFRIDDDLDESDTEDVMAYRSVYYHILALCVCQAANANYTVLSHYKGR